MLDPTALFSMSYGLYVVSADDGDHKAGCLINTATQVTAEPIQVMVAVNKDNFTADVIKRAGAFSVTVLDETADMPYIGNFGFRTSENYDKFEKYGCAVTDDGCPYSPEHICAVMSAKLVQTVDVGSHYLFIGQVTQAEKVGEGKPMTYGYYHSVLKGKTPPKASSYVAS